MKRAISGPCWALVLGLITGAAQAQAPEQIVLELPANASTGISVTPTFEWFKDDLADSYTIEVADDAGFSNIVFLESEITDTTKTLAIPLANGTVYHWRVRGTNGEGTGPDSDAWSFTTIVSAPDEPNLTSPADDATGVSTSPTLEWGAVSGADTYTVDVDTDPAFGSIDQTQTSASTSFSPTVLTAGTEYHWRVKASNAGGDSGFSSRSFTTAYDPPGAPSLTSPADAAEDVALQPNLDWDAASGTVSSYHIQVSTDGFATFAVRDSSVAGGTTDYTPAAPLATETTYSWRVRAKNPDGVTGPWSAVRTFTTVPPPPAAPTLTTPADGATGVSVDPTLEWDAVSGADTYTAEIDTDPGFGSPDQTQTSASTSFEPNTLNNGTTYHWRVKASNDGGESGYSARSFTTVFSPPGAPTLTSPADEAENVPLTPTFMWTTGSGTSAFYRIDISTENDFTPLVISDTTGSTSYTPSSPLNADEHYFWRVRGDNNGGPGNFSSTFDFTTLPPAPGQVTLSSPADDAVEVSLTPNLNWANQAGADTYTVQVSTVSNFSSTVVDQSGLASSNYTLPAPLAQGTEYFWRARAENEGGQGPFSAVWSFTTVTSKIVILSSPTNGATSLALSPTLSWNSVVGATSYRVQVSKSSDMSSPVVDQSGVTETSLVVGPLDASTIHHWRVRADNAAADQWSTVWSFVTGTGAPGAVTLVSPADDATAVSREPSFTWNEAGTATSYRFDLSTASNFSSFVVSQSGIEDTSFDPGVELDGNQEYFWRVRASNAQGDGPFSSVFSFTTIVDQPGAPTLTSPSNGAVAVSVTPTLVWGAVTKGLGKTQDGSTAATSYDLEVATDGNFNTKVVSETGIAGTSYDDAVLSNGVQYFWRVRGVNEAGAGPFSSAFNFITVAGGAEQVTLVSPADASTEVDLSPVLRWNSVSGAATYQLQVSKVPDFTTLALNIASVGGTEFQTTDLDGSTKYYWRVRAGNSGAENWSVTWSFTTGSGTPETVTLVSPIDGATNVELELMLSWNQALKATAYELQLATDNQFNNIVFDFSTSGTSLMIDELIHGQVYYWRVRGTNSVTDGEWSTVRGFITERGGDTQVILISPEGGTTGVPLETELVWHSVPGATSYHVQVATTFSFQFGSILYEASQHPDTVFQLIDLGPDSTFAWRIKASNAAVNNWSITGSFVTGKGVPSQVVLESPLNNAVEVDLEPELIWTVPTRATSFNLQVALDENFSTVLLSETGLTEVSFTLPQLDPVTDYFWRVQGQNQDGVGEWSETRKFTTIGVEPPVAPVLISPLDGAAEVSFKPLFSWDASETATSYKLEVATSQAFTTVAIAVVVAQPFFQATALSLGQDYFWRVEARNAGGSNVSDVWSFTTVVETAAEDEEIPEDFSLSQNYPNPFNPSTSIEFAMPRAGQASLVIYDVRGEEVARLVDGFKSAGRHAVRWDAGFLPSGVYLYRFQADGFSEVRKLTLAK